MSRRAPVYQVDFQAVAAGKVIATSKQKVRWRFGFPNNQALDAGRTGVDCRGEEHDVVLIWSVTSGKRQVYMDGKEVHFSTSRSQTFQYSWSAKGNHVMKVVAFATQPMHGMGPQFDLHIDGQSFFSFPKSYELGIRGAAAPRSPGTRSYDRSGNVRPPSSREQEEADLQRAINASLQESRSYLAKEEPRATAPAPPPVAQEADLMDLGGGGYQQPGPPVPQYGAPPGHQYGAPPPQYGAPQPYGAPQHYGAAPPQPQNQPGPQAVVPYEGTSQANSNYGVPPQYQSPAPAGYSQPAPPSYSQPATPGYSQGAPTNTYAASPPAQSYDPRSSFQSGASQYSAPSQPAANGYASYQPSSVPTGDLFAPPPVDPFAPSPQGQGGMFNQFNDPFAPRPPEPPSRDSITRSILGAYGAPSPQNQGQNYPQQPGQSPQQPGQSPETGNGNQPAQITYGAPAPAEKPVSEFDLALKRLVNVDRIDEPAEQEFTLTMKKKEVERKTKDGKSKGLPPAAIGVVGSNATLDHIKQVKPETAKTGEGVMRAPPQLFHPDAVNAGALVIHGQGPPPIQRGFGLGYGAPPPNFQQPKW